MTRRCRAAAVAVFIRKADALLTDIKVIFRGFHPALDRLHELPRVGSTCVVQIPHHEDTDEEMKEEYDIRGGTRGKYLP